MYCLLCFSVSPLLLLSLSLSSLSLISGLKSLDILLHPQKHTLTEWKSCYKQPKPTFCSPLCCYFALQSVSLSLSRPLFFPLTTFSFSITLSRPLITVPMFSLIIFIYSLPPSPPISVCEAGWLWMLTWEGLTFRGRSPACSTDISARLWWCLWTEMCGGKSCLSPCLPAALTLRLHQLEWDVL